MIASLQILSTSEILYPEVCLEFFVDPKIDKILTGCQLSIITLQLSGNSAHSK